MLPLPRGAAWQLLFLFCAVFYIKGVRTDGRVVCYYTNWSVYRPGTAKFNPQNINPYLCTHLIYAFGGFTKDNQMKPFDKYQDIEQGGYAKFTGLKTYNKQLKTMIAIGGWNEASSRFSPLVASPERRQKFIKNILKFLRQNHFDGIDLDWEYPAHREGGKARDRDNYSQFVQELRAEFERESEKTGRPRLLVTMAVPAGIEYIEKGYDIPKLNKYLDWFNVLTYDFHSSQEPSVNHHAPLYSLEEESEYNYDAELNIDYSIKFYLNAGADRDKLVLGIPTYGRSFTLINEESTEIGAPAEAPGEQGDATREKGYLAYYEICQNIKEDPEWTVVQPNPNAMGPYAYRRNQWVGYDDEAIVRKKAQYVVDNGLGGIMFWAIDNDDFRGTCTGKPYPLIEAAKDAMLDALGLGINEVSKPSAPQKPSRSRSRENSSSTRNRITTTEHKLTYAERKGNSKRTQNTQQTTRNRQQSTTTTAPTNIKLTEVEGSSLYIGGRTTTPPPPTTPDPGTDFKCEDEGFFQHPRDCKKYYWCLDSGPSGLGIVAHQFTCPSGLYFNPAADSCDFARNVPCKIKKSTTAAPITSPTTTTTARPTSSYNRITAATSRATTFFRTTPRTTTTTETAEETDIEYEEEDEENPPSPFAKPKGFDKDSEEDPQVIKELIELIRKVGGIEELEKHLLRKEDGTISIKENSSSSSSSIIATTPSSISKSLYEKVLSKPNALNSFRNRFTSTSSFRTTKAQIKAEDNTEEDEEDEQSHESDSKSSGASAGYSKYSSVLRGNSRQGPQNEGIDKLSEFNGFFKEKKQYITINRNRGTKQTSADEEEVEVSGKSSTESYKDKEEEVEVSAKSTRKPSAGISPAYSTIRRARPSTTTEATQEEDEEEKELTESKSYSFLNRNRIKGNIRTELPEVAEVTAGSTRYKYLERSRPTRPTTESSSNVDDDKQDGDDNESENQENTVHFKAVNIENTRVTQQEFTTNTQRTYANIGRRTTTSTTATPETETTSSADKTFTTTTTATPTTSTKETPLTTPLTILETTTPDSVSIITSIPITTITNPTTISTTTTSVTKTTTTTLPNGEDVPKSLTTTPNSNEINSDISESIELSQHINSILTDSFSKSTPSPTTESGLYTNEQESDSQLTTTETTLSSTTTTINDSDNLTKTENSEQEEVNLVSKQRNKTLYNTRTRTTTTTFPKTTTTTTNIDIETTSSPTITTNAKKILGVRRQQNLLNRSSQTKITSTASTSDITTPTAETTNSDFLGTVSSPRPFGFPKRRNRPTSTAGITTTSPVTEEISKPSEDILVTKQKTTRLNAAANSQPKKYQFQRRTTTTTSTTTTTARPVEANGNNDSIKTQVNVNDANESQRKTSTDIPETTAPITTEIPPSPATFRRIKVLKLKRPVVLNISNHSTTANPNASSATNLNASHTETQNIVRFSSVDNIEPQIAKTQTQILTETEINTKTQTPIPAHPSPIPKRKVIVRKLIRPVNKTTDTDSTNETQNEKSSVTTSTFTHRKQNVTRFGFNRSTKFGSSENGDESNEEEKIESLTKRGKSRLPLSSGIRGTAKNSFNRFSNRQQPSTTTESPKTSKDNEEDEEYEEDEDDEYDVEDEDDDEDEEEEISQTTTSKPSNSIVYTSKKNVKFTGSLSATTERSPAIKEANATSFSTELETSTQNNKSLGDTASTASPSSTKSEQSEVQQEGILRDRFRFSKTSHEEEETDGYVLKLRKKVKQELAKGDQKDEGVLSDRLKSTKVTNEEEEIEKDDPLQKLREKVKQDLIKVSQVEGVLSDRFNSTKVTSEEDDPLLKLRNKVKQDLAKSNQVEGVLNDRLKSTKTESEVEDRDDPLFKLRNKVKQDLAKGDQEEGVVNYKLKKLLETKNTTSTFNYKVEAVENEPTSKEDSLNLQKIRDKVQTNLSKNDQEQGVISTKYKKIISEGKSSPPINYNSVDRENNENENTTELSDNENETTTELSDTLRDGDLIEISRPFTLRNPLSPKTKLASVDKEDQAQTVPITPSAASAPKDKPTFRRKLVAKRPYVPTKSPLNTLSTTTPRSTTTSAKSKYVRRKFGKFDPINTSSRNTDNGFIRTDPKSNILPGTNRFKVEGSAAGQNGEIEDDEENDDEEGDEEAENEEVENDKAVKLLQAAKPNINRPPGLFNRPQSTILKNPTTVHSNEQGSGDNEDEDEEEETEEDEDDDENEDEDKSENENSQEADKTVTNHHTYKPKDNRILPGVRPALTTTPTIKKPFTPSRVANTPYRIGSITTTKPNNKINRYGSVSKSTAKPRVANRPLGVSVPNLTIKPVANDYERTTVLIPTKPAPFINPNTRAYERKYTGPTTESSADINNDSNPLIEDLNIEALNARNKKIFDINSKKHTTLKPKVIIPLAKLNENTQEQQTNTEFENDENYYQSSVAGLATTSITLDTNTKQQQQQEHEQSTTLGTQNTDDAIQSNVNNLNEISSQDGFTTTPPSNTTLLHIFTLSDAGHTTPNPFDDGYQVVPRLIVERVKPKHKVVEINRIVEVNSKEEKLRRKSKANTIVSIEGSQTYKVESLPHIEQLGEISVVKYVHQVDGSDIKIEGRSTVTDYTPTEPTVPGTSQPVRHSPPERSVGERYGKALLPEVIREAVETSTISLEGLFESARKGKVLNTIDVGDFVRQEPSPNKVDVREIKAAATEISNNYHVESVTETSNVVEPSTESFNILKSIAFDVAKINLEPNSNEIETIQNSMESTSSTTTTLANSSITTASNEEKVAYFSTPASITTPTPTPEILSVESRTVVPEDTKATTVAAALFPQYVRPIVPLLRPESNESSPLVISIANLDKVTLSKVGKMFNGLEVEEDEQHQQPQPQLQTQQKIDNNIIPNTQTETPDTLTTTYIFPYNRSDKTVETQTQQHSKILDSHAAFSSRLASVIKAPALNSLTHIEKQISSPPNSTKNPLGKVHQVTQTKLYTINEGSVGSTTSSTTGSKISETVSFSSETTVVRRKQPRKAKSAKYKNKILTTFAPATEVVSER